MVEGKFLLGPGLEDTSTEKTRRRGIHRVSGKAMQKQGVVLSRNPRSALVEQNFPRERLDTSKVCRGRSESSRGGK